MYIIYIYTYYCNMCIYITYCVYIYYIIYIIYIYYTHRLVDTKALSAASRAHPSILHGHVQLPMAKATFESQVSATPKWRLPKSWGTPKSSILVGFYGIFHYNQTNLDTPILGNTPISNGVAASSVPMFDGSQLRFPLFAFLFTPCFCSQSLSFLCLQ